MNIRQFLAAAIALTLLYPTAASSTNLSGTSRTYLLTRELTDGSRLTPLYEYLDIRTDGIGTDAVSFSAGGWYRYYLQSEGFDKKDTGDLQYAYLTLRKRTANATLNIGRVVVHEGAASSQLDGASARVDLLGGFTVGAFGGVPLETDLDTRSGDSVYGGRLAHSVPGIYTIGVSYLQETNDGKDFREEGGIDLWLGPVGKLGIMGQSSYNSISKAWMQHQYAVLLGPFGNLRLAADASKTYYREFFTATTMNAFSFPNIDLNEIVTVVGGSADYAFASSLSAGIDVKNFDHDVAKNSANYYGVRFTYASPGGGAGLAVHRMDGPTARLQYDEQRVSITKTLSMFDLSLDIGHISFAQPINGVSDSSTGTAAAGCRFSQNARVVAAVDYAKTPDYDRDIRSMLTFVYSFDAKIGGTGAKKRPAGASKPAMGSHCQEGGINPVPCAKKN